MAVLADAKKAGGAQAKAADQMIKDYTGRKGYVGSQIETLNPYQAMMNELASKSIDTAKADGTFATAVDLFLEAVRDFKSTVSPSGTTTGRTTGQSRYQGAVNVMGKPGGTVEKIGTTTYIYDNAGNKYDITTPAGIKLKKVFGKAMGGYISGPGSGTSDSIPAMLSNGEYVVSAKAVQAAGIPMLDRINKMSKGGPVFDIPAYPTEEDLIFELNSYLVRDGRPQGEFSMQTFNSFLPTSWEENKFGDLVKFLIESGKFEEQKKKQSGKTVYKIKDNPHY